jgi:hypothetical protein
MMTSLTLNATMTDPKPGSAGWGHEMPGYLEEADYYEEHDTNE